MWREANWVCVDIDEDTWNGMKASIPYLPQFHTTKPFKNSNLISSYNPSGASASPSPSPSSLSKSTIKQALPSPSLFPSQCSRQPAVSPSSPVPTASMAPPTAPSRRRLHLGAASRFVGGPPPQDPPARRGSCRLAAVSIRRKHQAGARRPLMRTPARLGYSLRYYILQFLRIIHILFSHVNN